MKRLSMEQLEHLCVSDVYGHKDNDDGAATWAITGLTEVEAGALILMAKEAVLLRKALAHYAERKNWSYTCGDEVSTHLENMSHDASNGEWGSKYYYAGVRAREALTAVDALWEKQGDGEEGK